MPFGVLFAVSKPLERAQFPVETVDMPAVLVTGASTGIGEATALHLDRLGHHVFAGVRKDEDGKRLEAEASDRLRAVRLDVTDQEQVEAAADRVAAELGTIRFAGVVNNAGIALGGPIEHLPLDVWRRQLEVNVVGLVSVTKAFLPLVREGHGRIVMIGSMSGKVATPMTGPYNASKFAVEGLADTLRMELHEWGIPVIVVEPGAVKTPIWERAREQADDLEQQLGPDVVLQYRKLIDLTRRGIEAQDERGADPLTVARAVEHALFSTRPRTRYPVGIDAKGGALLARLLPDRARDAVLRVVTDRI
jgi:NAD(P)-dependent dehydrogenase (short-subunit alcohol dehydrogenase family)